MMAANQLDETDETVSFCPRSRTETYYRDTEERSDNNTGVGATKEGEEEEQGRREKVALRQATG